MTVKSGFILLPEPAQSMSIGIKRNVLKAVKKLGF